MKGKPTANRERKPRSLSALWQLSIPVTIMSGLIYLSISGDDTSSRPDFARTLEREGQGIAVPDADVELQGGSAAPASSTGVSAPQGSLAGLTFEDLRSRTTHRAHYTTLAERCATGTAEAGMQCASSARYVYAGGLAGDDGADDGLAHEISGRVMTPDGFGVGGVSIVATQIAATGANDSVAREPEPAMRFQSVSIDDGNYAFRDLPEGNYRIQSARHGRYGAVRITARTGVDYADIVLSEQKQYLVEGSVTDEYGSPLSHVTVLPVVEGVPSVRTDRDGRFELPVSLSPSASHLTLRFEATGFSELSYSASLLAPEKILDTRDRERLALDIVMEPVAVTTNVAGTLTTPEGRPIVGKTVELRAIGSQESYRAVTDRHGEYEFPVITADKRYQLRASGQPNYADYRSEVLVTTQEYRFDAVMEPFEYGTLRGRIVDQDGGPVRDVELALRNAGSAQPNAVVRSDASGSFVIREAPAGESVLASQAMPSFSVRGIEVQPGRESFVDLVVDWGSHELAGVVVDRNGRAVPASQVLLKWSHETDKGIRSSVTRRTATDYQGRFKFDQLGPGPHSLVVDAPGFERVALNHELRRDGYDVTVHLH
ncbi:MAG: carboxypeptidase-like regulatory domain-containing protein [Gammaproteobacteria bacterium]|jgi:protocatechuate 3,4-dioxygenase beta subunit